MGNHSGASTWVELKVVKIGNSLGVRLPRDMLKRMRLGDGDKLILT
jgi:antitoxin component of MazEF toxin-antitoxin module